MKQKYEEVIGLFELGWSVTDVSLATGVDLDIVMQLLVGWSWNEARKQGLVL